MFLPPTARMAITRSKRTVAQVSTVVTVKSKATGTAKVAVKARVSKETQIKTETPKQDPATKARAKPKASKADSAAAALQELAPPPPPPKGPFKFVPGFVEALAAARKVDPSLDHVLAKEHLFVDCFGYDAARADRTPAELLQQYYEALLRGVLAQQISGAAANSIQRKFKLLFDQSGAGQVPAGPLQYEVPGKDTAELRELDKRLRYPGPAVVAATRQEVLRSAGLSARKAEYVVGLSQAFVDGRLTYALFKDGTDDEIVDALVALKGIGPWSADMFLLFGLQRLNVFSIGDLGIQRGVSVYLARHPALRDELAAVDWTAHAAAKEPGACVRSVAKKPTPAAKAGAKNKWKVPDKNTMEFIANKYAPYRSVLMLALWHMSSMDLSALDHSSAGK